MTPWTNEKLYSAVRLREIANLTEVTYDQWRARGYIPRAATGSGHRQAYSREEVLRTAEFAAAL